MEATTKASKPACHCTAFNYCIDENCTCWTEIINSNGHTQQRETDRQCSGRHCCTSIEK